MVFSIDDSLDALFLGAFLFGILFTALSLTIGAFDIGLDHGGHGGDIGHDHGVDATSPFNVSTALAFIAWFGGIGYLAHNGAGWTAVLSVLLAVLGGLAGAYLIYLVIVRVIRPGETAPLDPRDFELQGTLAHVTSSVRAGGTGEITYVQGGVRMVRAARSADGRPIPRGTEVVVMRAEHGVGIVTPWEELMHGEESSPQEIAERIANRLEPEP